MGDRIILWEHYGMIDDESYFRRQKDKEIIYEKAGFQILKISEIADDIELSEKVLIISTPEDLRNNKELLEKLNLLKEFS